MNKKCFILIMLSASLLFTGCNKLNISTLQKESEKNISNIQSIIGKGYVPLAEKLVIPAFEYNDSNSEELINTNNTFTAWNIVFSKPISEQLSSSLKQPEFPFQYTNIIATYTPRYTSANTNNEITGFNKFINKLENLYLQMQDSILVSKEIAEIQKNFNFQLKIIKEKINTMQNKKEEITDEQLKNAQEILKELVNTANQLKTCDKKIKNLINEIDTEKNNLILNTDTLSNKYIMLINTLDNKMSHLNNIQQYINQLDLIIINQTKNNTQLSNHYIDSNALKPISRKEYENKYKDIFSNFCVLKPKRKMPLPYIVDENNKNNTTQFM